MNYQQDNWVDWLPIAEFAINNSISETTQTTPFEGNYGFKPRMSFDLHPTTSPVVNPAQQINRDLATDIATRMKDIWQHLQEEMGLAQTRMEGYANRYRIPGPRYEIGDKVWLSTKNIKTQRPSRKLDHKQIGPYEITHKIGSTSYKLKLPQSMKIHPVFHSSLLQLDYNNPLLGQTPHPPPPVVVDDEEEWEVEAIQDSRLHYCKLQYRVAWTGHPQDTTWYPANNFEHAKELIEAFHNKYPDKPGP